jgi:hypothetical protein
LLESDWLWSWHCHENCSAGADAFALALGFVGLECVNHHIIIIVDGLIIG